MSDDATTTCHAARSGLREDSARFFEHPEQFRRVRPRVFKLTHRTWVDFSAIWASRTEGEADLAGPDRLRIIRRSASRTCCLKAKILGRCLLPTGLDAWVGPRRRAPTRRWRERRRIALAPRRIGSQSAGTAQDGTAEARNDPERPRRRFRLADLIVLAAPLAVEKQRRMPAST